MNKLRYFVGVILAVIVIFFGVGAPDSVSAANPQCECDIRAVVTAPKEECTASGKHSFAAPAQMQLVGLLEEVGPRDCDYENIFITAEMEKMVRFTADSCALTENGSRHRNKYTIKCDVKGASAAMPSAPSDPTFNPPRGVGELNVLGLTGISGVRTLIGRMIRGFMGIIGTIALAMFIYGGLLFMIGEGGEKKGQAAKILIWASLGIIVILLSYVIVDFIFEGFRIQVNPNFNS